ncbi:MAG: glycosyl hydrolase family 18 protein [Thermoflexaceae bacterium]|nr:glycosyl hydrolase family 18 protein [Thermoflexaceae bacterium]
MDMVIYVVKQGDNVDDIAGNYGVLPQSIIAVNQLEYPYRLAVGQALLIEDGEQDKDGYAYVNGFAYPFISRWVLENTLPYLSFLSVFSYGFTMEGYILYPPLPDEWMIALALENAVTPILTLTPLDENGQFNNNLITSVVNSREYTERLVSEVLYVLRTKGYGGVDVDFEYIKREDRDAFTAFVETLKNVLAQEGYLVSVDLAPKISRNQPGLLYAGKDYASLGRIADSVLLMTYEWGYKYGAPMGVAPINKVRQVVEYAVTEIEPEKIMLGIPNYGYDWPLPFVQGVTVARTIVNVEAVQIAIENNAVIQFDETAKSPYFYYTSEGVEHVVWFEDVRSLQAKFDLIKEFQLRGAGYWTVMSWFWANWLLLSDNFDIIKRTCS